MLNRLIIVGRLVQKPELKKSEDGKDYTNITLAVPRNYKNEFGEYDSDYIDCVLSGNVAQNTVEYCHKGDLIGLAGRLQTKELDNEYNKIEVVGHRVTFLKSSMTKTEENIEIEKNI